jgi:chromate transporter
MGAEGETSYPQPPFRAVLATFFKIGCLSFGGAAGQIALMHRVIVDEKGWMAERDYLDGLNFCTLLPGPEAQQLATYIGWRLHGVRGGLASGLLFTLPGAALILLLAQLYVLGAGNPAVEGALLGIKAAVIVIVFEAVLKIGRRSLKTFGLKALAIGSFLIMFASALPFPALIGLAALIGILLNTGQPKSESVKSKTMPEPGPHLRLVLVCLFAWWAPVGLAAMIYGSSHLLVEIGVFFSKLAVITFGGAYALLAYLTEEAVARNWVNAKQMLDALGLAETTPGPTILVNPFIAFLAGWQKLSSTPLAWAAGLMALWTTFAPSFLWIFAGAPYMARVSANRYLANALKGISAAVVGIIASVGAKFALLFLFREVAITPFGSFTIPVPVTLAGSLNLLLVAVALVLAFVLHVSIIRLIAIMAVLGLVLSRFMV